MSFLSIGVPRLFSCSPGNCFDDRIGRPIPRPQWSMGGSADEAARAEIGGANSDAAKDRPFRPHAEPPHGLAVETHAEAR